jgi:hypothetical protein
VIPFEIEPRNFYPIQRKTQDTWRALGVSGNVESLRAVRRHCELGFACALVCAMRWCRLCAWRGTIYSPRDCGHGASISGQQPLVRT